MCIFIYLYRTTPPPPWSTFLLFPCKSATKNVCFFCSSSFFCFPFTLCWMVARIGPTEVHANPRRTQNTALTNKPRTLRRSFGFAKSFALGFSTVFRFPAVIFGFWQKPEISRVVLFLWEDQKPNKLFLVFVFSCFPPVLCFLGNSQKTRELCLLDFSLMEHLEKPKAKNTKLWGDVLVLPNSCVPLFVLSCSCFPAAFWAFSSIPSNKRSIFCFVNARNAKTTNNLEPFVAEQPTNAGQPHQTHLKKTKITAFGKKTWEKTNNKSPRKNNKTFGKTKTPSHSFRFLAVSFCFSFRVSRIFLLFWAVPLKNKEAEGKIRNPPPPRIVGNYETNGSQKQEKTGENPKTHHIQNPSS